MSLKIFKANFYSSQKHINLAKFVCGTAKDSQLNWNAAKTKPNNGIIAKQFHQIKFYRHSELYPVLFQWESF